MLKVVYQPLYGSKFDLKIQNEISNLRSIGKIKIGFSDFCFWY